MTLNAYTNGRNSQPIRKVDHMQISVAKSGEKNMNFIDDSNSKAMTLFLLVRFACYVDFKHTNNQLTSKEKNC